VPRRCCRAEEEERRRKASATAGYLYDYGKGGETAVWVHTREKCSRFCAGNGGVRRERKEEDVGVKDSPPNMAKTMAKTVEGPAYPPPVPATTLTTGGIEAQAQPAEPLKR